MNEEQNPLANFPNRLTQEIADQMIQDVNRFFASKFGELGIPCHYVCLYISVNQNEQEITNMVSSLPAPMAMNAMIQFVAQLAQNPTDTKTVEVRSDA